VLTSSPHHDEGCGQLHEASEVPPACHCGCHTAELLDFANEAIDAVPLAVQAPLQLRLVLPVRPRRDRREDVGVKEVLADLVAVVGADVEIDRALVRYRDHHVGERRRVVRLPSVKSGTTAVRSSDAARWTLVV